MAKRLNVKLKGFKLTKKPTTGKSSSHLIPRSFQSKKTTDFVTDFVENLSSNDDGIETHSFHNDIEEQLPTHTGTLTTHMH